MTQSASESNEHQYCIEPLASLDSDGLLSLNNAHAVELSWLTEQEFKGLLAISYHSVGIAPAGALLVAIDQAASYDNRNFQWFRARFSDFIYVDRVVVSQCLRGKGVARALYEDLFRRANVDRKSVITCEVNLDPPNQASLSFHRRLGFQAVGESVLPSGKRVEYELKEL